MICAHAIGLHKIESKIRLSEELLYGARAFSGDLNPCSIILDGRDRESQIVQMYHSLHYLSPCDPFTQSDSLEICGAKPLNKPLLVGTTLEFCMPKKGPDSVGCRV